MVQPELHSEDEGPQGNGDTGQPVADQAVAGVPQPLEPGDSVEGLIRQDPDVTAAQTRRPRYEAFLVRAGEELVAWLKTLASAAVYATLIVTFGFQVARVEGKSMQPTLEDQDRLIVNKAIYKFFEDPQPGDIVMHYYPVDPDKSFVKRIIAEAGDTVRIEDGQVYVNEVLFPVAIPPEFRSREDYGPEVVQDAYYFVMGDHRKSSSDSRTWGQVPKKYIVGKVQLRWWPLTDAELF
ncbi:MAG: signal peptidase I [Acidobacteria bacterium]|nr:signal peptidase I [Acidobacteriota bacterium]